MPQKKNHIRLTVEALEGRELMSTAGLFPVTGFISTAIHQSPQPMAIIQNGNQSPGATPGFLQDLINYEQQGGPKYLIPVNVDQYAGRPPVFYVNGILDSRDQAISQGELLSDQLQRPVYVIYNQTNGFLADVTEAAIDMAGPEVGPLVESLDPTTRTIYEVLQDAFLINQPISIVSHSEGTLQVNNALDLLAHNAGGEQWIEENVAWVALAPVFNVQHGLAAMPNHFTAIYNQNDGVTRIIGRNDLTLGNILNVSQTTTDHAMTAYLPYLSPDMLTISPQDAPSVNVVDIPPANGLEAYFARLF